MKNQWGRRFRMLSACKVEKTKERIQLSILTLLKSCIMKMSLFISNICMMRMSLYVIN